MNRYEKILNNRVIVFGLLALAGWFVISESYLWWAQLSENAEQASDVALQENESGAGGESTASSSDASSTATDTLNNLAQQPTFEEVANVPDGEFNYGGSTTWAPLRKVLDPALMERFSAFQLQYTSPAPDSGRVAGSGTGIRMLLDGELDFSQSSRPLKEKERAEAKRQGNELKQVAVAIDGIAVAVNPSLGITGLTVTQLKQIYTGQVTNWRELGGPDLAILPYTRIAEDSGTVEFFTESVLDEEQYAPWTQFVENTTVGVRRVAENQGGIYYASAPEIVSQCLIKPLPLGEGGQFVAPYEPPYVETSDCPRYRNRLNAAAFQSGEYPLTRKLFVIVKENGEEEEQIGVAYANLMLTEEAKALIEGAGFVPLEE
ncbi:MAG: PstS family phosphate ABC transporter substrate-binding protein [Cyanobacteria bacterium P01_D01_bin.105]